MQFCLSKQRIYNGKLRILDKQCWQYNILIGLIDLHARCLNTNISNPGFNPSRNSDPIIALDAVAAYSWKSKNTGVQSGPDWYRKYLAKPAMCQYYISYALYLEGGASQLYKSEFFLVDREASYQVLSWATSAFFFLKKILTILMYQCILFDTFHSSYVNTEF